MFSGHAYIHIYVYILQPQNKVQSYEHAIIIKVITPNVTPTRLIHEKVAEYQFILCSLYGLVTIRRKK